MKFCALLLCASIALASAVAPHYNRPISKNYYGQHAPPTRAATPTYAKNIAKGQEVETLRNENEINADGSYHYAYETSNGISASESGIGGVSVQGSSSYISPEGIEIKTTYVADETGYHPVGDHIPKTPDYVYRALEYIRTHPPPNIATPNLAPPPRRPAARQPIPVTRKPVPVTRKPVPATRKPLPATRKPVPVTRKPVPVTRKPVQAARKVAAVAYKKPAVVNRKKY